MTIASRGATMAVDWEQRVDFPRLRAGAARTSEGRAGRVRPRRAPALRPEQHPLRHELAHRRVGARQERALRPPLPRLRPDPLGLRLGRPPPPALRAVAAESSWRAGVTSMRGAMPDETGVPDAMAAKIVARARGARPEGRAARRGHVRHGHAGGAAPRRDRDDRRAARDALGAEDQDRGRAGAPLARRRDRRRGLRADLRAAPAGRARARDRRRGDAGALRARLRAGRGDQRRLGRPLQPAPARLLRPADPAGRPGLLRHHPLVHGLPDVLLPHVLRRQRVAEPDRRVPAVPPVARRRDRPRPARA